MSEHVEYHRFKKGEHCTVEGCRSRRYYYEAGQRFCDRHGHQQEGYKQIAADEDDFNTQGRKTRRKRELEARVSKVLTGRDATELFLQCWQLVLWKQVSWLRDTKGLPGKLETVVRDLWNVRLRAVKGFGNERTLMSDSGSVGYSSSDAQTDSDGMGSGSVTSGVSRLSVRRRKKPNGLPKIIDTLGLCYLGILLLRLPVSMGQLHRWAEDDEIVYSRVITEIPQQMRARLPAYYLSALEIRAPLRRDDLHKAVLELIISYKQRFDFVFPPLNAPLILFKHVRDLGLPLEVYAGAQRLAKILKYDFAFPSYLGRHRVTAYPEVQIVALIIIATKLVHPFDGIALVPENIADPSVLAVDWKLWQGSFATPPSDGLKASELINISEEDVFKMSGKKLDDYLDWYQRMWVDGRDAKLPPKILELAPLHEIVSQTPSNSELSSDETDVRLRTIQSHLIWRKPVPKDIQNNEKLQRPGMSYQHYRRVEDLPDAARAFYEKAGENAGVTLTSLVTAVFLIERQIHRWSSADRRGKFIEEHDAFEGVDGGIDSEIDNDDA